MGPGEQSGVPLCRGEGWRISTWRGERLIKQEGMIRGHIRGGNKSASSVPSREVGGKWGCPFPVSCFSWYPPLMVFASFPGPTAFCSALGTPLSSPQMSLAHLVSVAHCSEMPRAPFSYLVSSQPPFLLHLLSGPEPLCGRLLRDSPVSEVAAPFPKSGFAPSEQRVAHLCSRG